MKYLLYYAPATLLRELPCNAGIDAALARAEEMRRQGVFVELVDTSGMEPAERHGRYIEAIIPSVLKKYRVRQVFGSRRRAGVPALAVVGPSGTVEDVYPHDRAGKLVTISDFFDSLREKAVPAGSVTIRSGRKRR